MTPDVRILVAFVGLILGGGSAQWITHNIGAVPGIAAGLAGFAVYLVFGYAVFDAVRRFLAWRRTRHAEQEAKKRDE